MKKSIKRVLLAFCAASIVFMSATAFASPTTEPGRTVSASTGVSSTSTETSSETDTTTAAGGVVQDGTEERPVPTPVSTGQTQQTNVVQDTEAQRAAEKKYASKGLMFFWIFLTILINAVLSFIIGNRFYKLARKDNHVSSELRALRRDLEEKFVNNVGGFSEMETDVANTNDNYSLNGSIKMPERKSADFAAESEDVFKKWESRMSQKRVKPVHEEQEDEDTIEEEPRRRKFQPSRHINEYNEDYDEEMDEPEEYEEKSSKSNNIKKKAKDILGDIFPFKED